MTTGRLEAFSDGVMAIIITIMVLELKAPLGSDFKSLLPTLPRLLNYLLSFIYVGIYWNNHHHLFQVIEKINGKILWANLLLLFWLSLLPLSTAWMDENMSANWPVAVYGIILLLSSISFMWIEHLGLNHKLGNKLLHQSLSNKTKERLSLLGYALGIAMAFVYPYLSVALYVVVALLWVTPDKRIEKNL